MTAVDENVLSAWILGHAAVTAVADRLRAVLPAGTAVQETLRGLPQQRKYPLVAVLPESERGREPVTRTGLTVQPVSTDIVVLTVVQMLNDPGGGGRARARLETLLSAQREGLSGWIPPGCPSPALWTSGQIQSLDATAAVWADRWRVDWYATHTREDSE